MPEGLRIDHQPGKGVIKLELFVSEPFIVENILPEKNFREKNRYFKNKKKEKKEDEEPDIVDEVEISPEAMEAFKGSNK